MKYQWSSKPPKGVPGVATDKADVWPKPDKGSLKYTTADFQNVAIGKLAISGRWEIYVWEPCIVTTPKGEKKIVNKWVAKSRFKQTHRIGYSRYENAYRSINQHLKSQTRSSS